METFGAICSHLEQEPFGAILGHISGFGAMWGNLHILKFIVENCNTLASGETIIVCNVKLKTKLQFKNT